MSTAEKGCITCAILVQSAHQIPHLHRQLLDLEHYEISFFVNLELSSPLRLTVVVHRKPQSGGSARERIIAVTLDLYTLKGEKHPSLSPRQFLIVIRSSIAMASVWSRSASYDGHILGVKFRDCQVLDFRV